MPLLSTVASLVRLPLRLVGGAIGLARARVGGHRSEEADRTPPFPTRPQPAPDPRPATRATPVAKAPAKGPVGVPAPAQKTAAKKVAAKKTVAKKAAARTVPAVSPAPSPAPVSDIDARASADDVDVKPSDVADAMGTQLEDRPPSPS